MTSKLPQKFGTLFLTLILITGIIIPSCENGMEEECDPTLGGGCGCPPTEYFDIQGMDVQVRERKDEITEIDELDTVSFENVADIMVNFEVDYHTSSSPSLSPKSTPIFSTMSSAYACSIVYWPLGSKTESLTRFEVITINDFDEEHKANESINDLLKFTPYTVYHDSAPLPEFLDNYTDNILEPYMRLVLSKAPTLDSKFHIKVIMELSTGEAYEAESKPFILLP